MILRIMHKISSLICPFKITTDKPAGGCRFIFLVLMVSMTFSACTIYKDVEVTEVLQVQITSFSTEKLEAEVFFQVNNPNWYKLKMTDAKIDLMLEGKKIAEVVLVEPIEIPKKMVSALSMKIQSENLDLQSLLSNAFSLLFKSTYEFEGIGYVQGKAMFVGRKVPVQFKENISKQDLGF